MKKKLALLLSLMTAVIAVMTPLTAFADSPSTVVTLGADLNADEMAAVLPLLGLDPATFTQENTVLNVTNAEEHQYLDSYLDPSVIGSRALSSCKVTQKDSGGITVETHNITYCTPSMYQSALATAGMQNAEVVVAGPFAISGTAALVGAMKAYSEMTGTVITLELVDASTQELVTTSEIAETVGDPEKVTQLIAAVKQIVINNNFETDEDIDKAIDDVAREMQITLSDEDRQLIRDLMKKLSEMDIDIDSLTQQASQIYEQLASGGFDFSQYGITETEASGIMGLINRILSSLSSWFSGLFG